MADVEDLFAERGAVVLRESVWQWLNQFGAHFAGCIPKDRPAPAEKSHLDEAVVPINGVKHWLWRAGDADRQVPGIRKRCLTGSMI